jgi:membrane-bound ClpP family serine protease
MRGRYSKMAVASLVLGIISLVIGIFSAGSLGWLGAILAVVGIILGALGRKNPEKKGMATAGLVCSIIGVI